MVPPVHAIVHDQTGHSLVIEYVNGDLKLFDNPIGVFTNAPTFDWHITNLRNYVNLSALNVPKIEFKNVEFAPLSQGSGMLGLPGDFTSPSRFIRATAFSQSIANIKNENEALDAAFHLLNLFDIPVGVVRAKENGHIRYEYTQWTSASDLKNKKYYFHTYNNRNLQMIDLMQMDLDAKEVVVRNM